MLFGDIFSVWGYPSGEPFLQGEPSVAVRQQYRQYLDGALYEALKRRRKESEQSEKKEPNGVTIDGEYEDITNKRALPGAEKL